MSRSKDMQEFDHVIIGGGLAGGNAAISIRENDSKCSILLITDENHLPYDRVPLSKNYLYGKMPKEALYMKKMDFYNAQKIQILSGKSVVSLDANRKLISLEDKSQIHFRNLLLATGGHVRHLDIPGTNLKNVFYLRTIEDSEAIKEMIQTAKNGVVIGGGFIGCELASTFAKKAISTTIIEAGSKILGRVFDSDTASWLESYFTRKGVKIMTKTMPLECIGSNGKVTGVRLQSGEIIPADFVVIGIGINPNVELAKNAGLQVDNGIIVNEYMQTSNPDIYAVSDVARFYSPVFGRHMRLEHYDLAVKQGRLAGENMTRKTKPFEDLPYFFSFMFDVRIEVYGDMSKYDTVITRGIPIENGNFTKFYLDSGIVNAVMMVTRKENVESIKQLIRLRKKIDNPASLGNESDKIEAIIT